MSIQKRIKRTALLMWLLLIFTAIGITITGVIFKQPLYRIIPLYISLIIGLMQSHANRYANLIGAGNSLLYAGVNMFFKMYASAASALLISCPMQLVTFILWNKHKYKNSTTFRRLSSKQRVIVVIGFITASLMVYFLLSAANSGYRLFDTVNTLLGILIFLLTMFSFVEYTWLQLPSALLAIITSVVIAFDYPERITYVIYGVYSLICMIVQYFTVKQLYTEQHGTS